MNVYETQWDRYRRLERALIFLFIGWIPFGMVSALITRRITQAEWAPFVLVIPYLAVLTVVSIRLGAFRCPRCKDTFSRRGWLYHNSFTRKCLNCGFPKYATADPGPEQIHEFENHQPLVGKVFDLLKIPLAVGTVAVGAFSLNRIDSSAMNPTQAVLLAAVQGGVLAIDLLFSLIAVAVIRRRDLKQIMKEGTPLFVRILFPAAFLFSTAAAIYHSPLFQRDPVMDALLSTFIAFLNMGLGLMALYTASRIRKRALER